MFTLKVIFVSLMLIIAVVIEQTSSVDDRFILRRVSEPLSYNLFLDINSENFHSYKGSVEIEMRYLDSMNYFYLNNKGVSIDQNSAKVTKPNGENLPLANLIGMDQFEQMYFGFAERLQQNGIYKIYLEFSNTIGTDQKGLYRSSYTVGKSKRYIVTTHFKPTHARMVFPCYDEPSYKAHFNITIRHRSQFHALSNMPVREITVEDENLIVTHFEMSPLMSTYLLAFVISDYSSAPDEHSRIKIFVPDHQIQYTSYALNFATKSLQYLENFFQHSFQLSKVDLVAIPDTNTAAMEGWGLITLGSDFLMYNEETTTVRTKQCTANLITHEFVHSWFGNVVTPEWWTYLWMSEGFARYFEYFVTDKIEDTWQLWDQFVVNNVHYALSKDDTSNIRPMNFYVTEPAVLNDLFDFVVYAKSASVIRMMQNVIGLDILKASLTEYITNSSYQTTKPEYLYRCIEKYNNVSLPGTVTEIFDNWTNNAGYPLVTALKNGQYVTFSQKRFWTPVEGEEAPQNLTYFVPLTYTFSSELNFNDTKTNAWLTPNLSEIVKEVTGADNWFLVNIQQVGYYRVNYDEVNWAALSAVLNSDEMNIIPVINRAQLMDDVSSLAKAGETNYRIALSLINYLKQELDYIPWSTAYNVIIFLDRMYCGDDRYSSFEKFIRTLTERVYEKNRLTYSNNHVGRLHRGNTLYLACFFGLEDCVNDAKQLTERIIADESYMPHAELQTAIFCTISKHEPSLQENLLQVIFERYHHVKESDNGIIDKFIAGMGCTTNITTINSYLRSSVNYSTNFNITSNEKNKILIGLLRGSYNGLRESLKFILEYYPDISHMNAPLEEIFEEFSYRVNTNETYKLLEQIVEKYRNVFSASIYSSASKALINGAQNLAWIAKYSEEISQWLAANDYTPSITTPYSPTTAGTSSIVFNLVGTIFIVCLMRLS